MVNPNNNISRYPHEDAKETTRTKPLAPPGNDTFRKSMNGRSSGKNQEEQALTEKQGKSPSLFDLSSSKKNSSPSSIKNPDSPVIPEPKTHLASSDEPLLDNQTPTPFNPSTGSSDELNSIDSVINSGKSKIKPQAHTTVVEKESITKQPNIKPSAMAVDQQDSVIKPNIKPSANVIPTQETTKRADYKPHAYVAEGSESERVEQFRMDRNYRSSAATTHSESKNLVESVSSENSSENRSSNNPSSSEQERLYTEVREGRERTRMRPDRNQQENPDSRYATNEDQKLRNSNINRHTKATDSAHTTDQTFTKEQQQLRIKKQQIKKQQEDPHVAHTQTASHVQSEKVKGLKESSFESPLLGDSSEEMSFENNALGTSLKKPMKSDEILSIQTSEDLSMQVEGTLLSSDENLSSPLARLDNPEKQMSEAVSGTIQKNVHSEIIAKKEMRENSDKLVAGLEGEVAELKGDQRKDNKTKPHHLETRHINIEVAPTIQTASSQTGMTDTQPPLPHQTTEELASQIISQIQVLTTKDEMRTTVTLKNPPVLEGATITLTASNNAKSEFNISIANLSDKGKEMLDLHLKENSLIDNLSKKGVTVHTLTTSTQPESFVILDDKAHREKQEQQPREQHSHPNERRQEEDRQQGRQQQRRHNQENEEEETE